jgi:hypothetical protein
VVVGARAPHHGNDQIAGGDAAHLGADLHHLTQGLVPNHEMFPLRRRRAVFERADLPIGAADSDLENPNLHVERARQGWSELIHETEIV